MEAQKQTIEHHIEQVRSMLGIRADGSKRKGRPPKSVATTPSTGAESAAQAQPTRKRRRFSAETRARMAAAQRKRYAGKKEVDEAPAAKAVIKKRKLSAAGRKRIIEATKRRWAAYKAKKAAS